MAGPIAVSVHGVPAVVRAFEEMSAKSQSYVINELTPVAESIRDTARSKIGARYDGASLSTILAKPRRGTQIWIVQDAKKVTGFHPNFAGLQMKHGFIPALEEHEAEVEAAVELAVARLATEFG